MDEYDRMIEIERLHYNGAIREDDIYWASKMQIAFANTPNVPLSVIVIEDDDGQS